MRRRWRRGPSDPWRRYLSLGLAVAVVLGLGWVFGTRVYAIRRTEADLRALRTQEEALNKEILDLRRRLAEVSLPHVVEREARLKLRWGFPDEERIVILRR